MDSLPSDERFTEVGVLAPTSSPDEIAQLYNDRVISLNGWLLYPDEARAVRDWLNKVLP